MNAKTLTAEIFKAASKRPLSAWFLTKTIEKAPTSNAGSPSPSGNGLKRAESTDSMDSGHMTVVNTPVKPSDQVIIEKFEQSLDIYLNSRLGLFRTNSNTNYLNINKTASYEDIDDSKIMMDARSRLYTGNIRRLFFSRDKTIARLELQNKQ